jgi:hypothetical protein
MITSKLRDEQFEEDIEKACHKYYVKTGNWSGDCMMRREGTRLVEDFDWDAVFEACLNVLERRGMLVSETQQEIF